ncbi:MAG: LysM peptidoglycan-binding domain-containing protein [Luteolibacter sp.]
MRFGIIIKIIAAFAVMGVVTFTGMLAYHIVVEPLGGIFEKIIPEAGTVLRVPKEEDFAKVLDAAEMPDFEPGDRAFQKAHEDIALGKIAEGRAKLMSIVNVFPSSPAAPIARRIVGEMNLDEILSSDFTEGKITYTVKRGDSYFAIVGRTETSLDMMMHLNGMMELKNLQPGDELQVMPLNYRILIEPERNSVSVWDEAKFICEYPIVSMSGVNLKAGVTTISSRRAVINGSTIAPTARNYRSATKSIQLKSPSVAIYPYDENNENAPIGIFLREPDVEELFLLTRSGNPVEIRIRKK